jgi:SAM-dependent methyltransferase
MAEPESRDGPRDFVRRLGQAFASFRRSPARDRSDEILAWNVKVLSSMLARESAERHFGPDRPTPPAPIATPVMSRGCVQSDFHEDWFLYWCDSARFARAYHRKLWEHAYVLQTLHSLDLLKAGVKGLGFGVGLEPEPSLMAARGVSVLATDLDLGEAARRGWTAHDQHAQGIERMHRPDIVPWETFHDRVSFRAVDMNAIPFDLDGQFDFCWSSCALEHLGSIRKGLDFIANAMRTLKPGGIAVHTTEYNYMRDEMTLDHWPTVLFRRRDLELIAAELTAAGHYVYPFDFDVLRSPLDFLIDVPPYPHEGGAAVADFHLRLAVDGFAATSFGIVVRKAGAAGSGQ